MSIFADTAFLFAALCGLVIFVGWAIEKLHRSKEDERRNEYDNDWE